MQKQFTPLEYLYIEISNQMGFDKITYNQRIQWVKDHMDELESLQVKAKEPSCYEAAVIALRDVQAGLPTGAIVRLDAVSSGIQILSVLTNCVTGCKATGAIDRDTDVRPVAYEEVSSRMQDILQQELPVEYDKIKECVMQSVYGGKKTAKDTFTPRQLKAFNQACLEVATGAFSLLELFISSWQTDKEYHAWYLPDGHYCYVPVVVTDTVEIMTEDLGPVSAIINQMGTKEYSVSLAANATQSLDAYLARSVIRHCSYNVEETTNKLNQAKELLNNKSFGLGSNLWDITMPLDDMNEWQLTKTVDRLNTILEYKPFNIITVHDSFACSPVNAQRMRKYYNMCLADLANDPEQGDNCNAILDSIIYQITNENTSIEVFPLLDKTLILENNYSIN